MDEFEKELKVGFLQEATQLLSDTEQCFLTLEANPNDPAILEQIFRLAHNLKGSSKAVGFDAMGAFTHEFESLLLKIKNGEVPKHTASLNLLLRCNDHLRVMVETLNGNLEATIDSEALIAEIKQGQQGVFAEAAPGAVEPESPPAEEEPPTEQPAEPAEESISQDELNLLLAAETKSQLQLQKDAEVKLVAAETAQAPVPPAPPRPIAAAPAPAPKPSGPASGGHSGGAVDDSIRVSLGRLERLLNFVGEMVILQSVLREQSMATEVAQNLRKTVQQLGKVTKEVQDISMSLRMVPVKQTFQKMQRIVRDTAQILGKKVTLHLAGEETELDKTVLEHLGDPLVHIIRNAVDHGVENAEKRRAAGKPETGNVFLSSYHEGGKLVIEVKDDGGGINGPVLLQKAIEKGVLRPGTQMSERDMIHLIFHPGFSTKAEVTEVSGRGVGMDVVKTNIEKLQGEVQISTVLGQGTTFKIYLPLTLAIIDGMVVTNQGERYIVPLAHVHESLKPAAGEIQYLTGLGEVLILRGENVPLYRLDHLLGKKPQAKSADPNQGIAIVVRATGVPFAIFVDDILGQQQIVIKKLGSELSGLKGFSGSAILGDGRPALILETPELVKRAGVSKNVPSSVSNHQPNQMGKVA